MCGFGISVGPPPIPNLNIGPGYSCGVYLGVGPGANYRKFIEQLAWVNYFCRGEVRDTCTPASSTPPAFGCPCGCAGVCVLYSALSQLGIGAFPESQKSRRLGIGRIWAQMDVRKPDKPIFGFVCCHQKAHLRYVCAFAHIYLKFGELWDEQSP